MKRLLKVVNYCKYIEKQLDSIYRQTRKPDELIIKDDGSNDATTKIVSDFIQQRHLENTWKLIINDQNEGCVKNFIEGAREAKGEIIFYSDQDDIWDIHKIEHMSNGFMKYSDMLACYCLRYFIDDTDQIIPDKYKFTTNTSYKQEGFRKVSFPENIKYNNSPGLCLAFRKTLLDEISSFILEENLTHDLPIGAIASLKGGYYVLNERLVYYRQHLNNLSAPRITIFSRISDKKRQLEGRNDRLRQMDAIYRWYKNDLNKYEKKLLKDAISSTNDSIRYLKENDIFHLFFLVFDRNPMINKWININNLCTGIYDKFH